MRTMIKILSLFAVLVVAFWSSRAEANTYTVCIRLPVTINDTTGQTGEIGGSGNWIARGIRINSVTAPNGTTALQGPVFTDPDSGCFSFTSSQTGTFTIGIGSTGQLAASNTLSVLNSNGNVGNWTATISLSGTGGTLIWPVETNQLRMYAIFAYAIESGFRGNYNGEDLKVWAFGTSSPCAPGCDVECTEDSDTSDISICSSSANRKFVMAHEYGHANLERTISFTFVDDCGNDGHNMRSLENDSCAAMEGWAHFVAADIWNGTAHDGGDPVGWFNYPNALGLINVEASQGGCQVSGETVVNFRSQYADHCFCSPDCSGAGVELDWMRFWWDFHTDTGISGFNPSHSQLQSEIDASGGWGSRDAWDVLLAGMTGDQHTRFQALGDLNGNSEL